MLPPSYMPVLEKYASTELLESLDDEPGKEYEISKIVFIGTCEKDVMRELDKFRNFPGCLQKFGPNVRSYQLPPTIFECPVGGMKMRKFIYKQDSFNFLMQQLPLDGPNKRISKIVGSVCEAYLKFKEEKLLGGKCELVVYNINHFEHLNYEFERALEQSKRMIIQDHEVQGFNFNEQIFEKLESVIGEIGPGHSVDSILDNRQIAKLKTSEKITIIRHVETLIDEMEWFIKKNEKYFIPYPEIEPEITTYPVRIWKRNKEEAFCFPRKVYEELLELCQEDILDEMEDMCDQKPIANINYRRLSPFFKKHVDEFWDLPLLEAQNWTDKQVFFFDMTRFIKEHPKYFPPCKNPKALQVRMFENDNQEPFCLAREVFSALLQLGCKNQRVLDRLEKLQLADPLATVYYEDYDKQKLLTVDLEDFYCKEPPVFLIKTPIMRTKNRAIFIPTHDGKFCILVADAFLEILRWLMSELNFFETTEYESEGWNKLETHLHITLEAIDKKFVTNKNAPSFIDVAKLEEAKEVLRKLISDEFKGKRYKYVDFQELIEESHNEEDVQEILNESIDDNNNEEMDDRELPVNNEEALNDAEVSNDEVTLNNEQAPNDEEGSNSEVESNLDETSVHEKTVVDSRPDPKTVIMLGLEKWLPNLKAHLESELDIDNVYIAKKTIGEMHEGVEYCRLLAVLEHFPQFSEWLVKEKAWPRKRKESSS